MSFKKGDILVADNFIDIKIIAVRTKGFREPAYKVEILNNHVFHIELYREFHYLPHEYKLCPKRNSSLYKALQGE